MYYSLKINRYVTRQSITFAYVYIRRKVHSIGLNDIPKIAVADIRKLLRQKGFAVQDGFTSLTTKCTLCSGEEKNTENKVYVNKTTGYFLCPKCNVHGEWGILERLIKKAKLESTIKDYIEKSQQKFEQFQRDWQKVIEETTSLGNLSETDAIHLFRLFELPFGKLIRLRLLSDIPRNITNNTKGAPYGAQ